MNRAAVVIIVQENLILSILRASNHKYALVGGKCELGELPKEAAIRETLEESGLHVLECHEIYSHADDLNFQTHCFHVTKWEGEIIPSSEGEISWVHPSMLTGDSGAYPEYNRAALEALCNELDEYHTTSSYQHTIEK